MKFPSLAAWLEWLEQSHPKEIDLGLDRIRPVAERLDLLEPRAKVVTVAGTNGKGSCVTATATLLRAANFFCRHLHFTAFVALRRTNSN